MRTISRSSSYGWYVATGARPCSFEYSYMAVENTNAGNLFGLVFVTKPLELLDEMTPS